jgi:hypothetical protein
MLPKENREPAARGPPGRVEEVCAMRDSQALPVTLVWIDSRAATIVRWIDGETPLERLASDVPVHRRGGVHVRHDPRIRPGGGGMAATDGEPRRHEHLARFLDRVADRLPEGDLEIIGPGTVREHLAGVLRARDHQAARHIRVARSARLTDAQLMARCRRLAGHASPRQDLTRRPGPEGRRALAAPEAGGAT